MPSVHALEEQLLGLDGRGYRAYRAVEGAYRADGFELHVDHVQGDPFADPSRLRVLVPPGRAGFPEWCLAGPARRTAAADFLNRALETALARSRTGLGWGRSGELSVLRPGQEVLDRTSLRLHADGAVEARFRAGLPARGRTILGKEAADLLCRRVPRAVSASLFFPALDADALRLHLRVVEDARALRAQLPDRGLVAFVADGACLPRRSGVDDRPLDAAGAVAFRSPDSLRVTLATPGSGPVSGMGVPHGVTLVVGGGFHGKSTLLRAIERGVYDHVPGDGRERVVTVPGAVKVRAEDGRSVAGADIANFVGVLPGGQDTRHFRTANASGSTSQAAAIVEALEVGASCLLLDEDTSATNLLIRDARMRALVPDEAEPIVPFVDRARGLARERGVSTVLALGGSGDYLDVADTVIAMRDFRPEDVTARARAVAAEHPSRRRPAPPAWREIAPRAPLPDSLDPSRGRREVHVRVFGERRMLFGREEVELGAVEQIVEAAQVRAMGLALARARGSALDGRRPLREALQEIMARLEADGLDRVQEERTGELAAFRIFELAAVLARVRSLRTRT